MIIKLDEDGDIAIENNSFVLIEGQEEIEQNLTQRLRMFYSEWFLDLREGVPYFEQVLKKVPDPVVLDSIFKRAISQTPGIEEILEFNMDVDASTRKLSLSMRCRTRDGILTIEDFEVI